ncbi:MAG: galactokinase [Robiginitalea sp.]|nr:galactokinase [Robiginitalea sp.]
MKEPIPNPSSVRVAAPGRINLIGEHTDYNEGFVLPAAIDLDLHFRLQKNGTPGQVRIYSEPMDASMETDLGDLKVPSKGWERYIQGVLMELSGVTDRLEGFDGAITSRLPAGAGLSSSAALECGLAYGLNALFALDIPPMELIRIAQRAEIKYSGTECGIMDQFACMMGKKDHFIFLDCRTLEYRYIPARLDGYRLVLINSRVTHTLSDSGYNQRREECRQGVSILRKSFPEIHSLRDASPDQLEAVRREMPKHIADRCRYVIEENARVLKALDALRNSDMPTLGNLLRETHEGLRDLYEVSCPELDFLVDTAMSLPGVAGSRMMGGGFGGCSLNLVREAAIPGVVSHLLAAYRERFGLDAESLETGLGDGVRLLP